MTYRILAVLGGLAALTATRAAAFADEAVTALRQWRYLPATAGGRPIGVRTELRFEFSTQGNVVTLLAIDFTVP